MVFDFDTEYIKGSTISNVDTLSQLKFHNEKKEMDNNSEDEILHWVETDILPFQCLKTETLQDPIFNNVYWRIKRNRRNDCSSAERPYKEVRHRLTIEDDLICNGDMIVPLQTVKKKT